jgi:hypothetical protein
MTPAEQAQYDADEAAWAADTAAQLILLNNASAIRTAINTRLAQIRTARTALAGGSIFAALSANEKAVIDGLLADNLYLGRLTLNLYDGIS